MTFSLGLFSKLIDLQGVVFGRYDHEVSIKSEGKNRHRDTIIGSRAGRLTYRVHPMVYADRKVLSSFFSLFSQTLHLGLAHFLQNRLLKGF